jgi:hypothetical protein
MMKPGLPISHQNQATALAVAAYWVHKAEHIEADAVGAENHDYCLLGLQRRTSRRIPAKKDNHQ